MSSGTLAISSWSGKRIQVASPGARRDHLAHQPCSPSRKPGIGNEDDRGLLFDAEICELIDQMSDPPVRARCYYSTHDTSTVNGRVSRGSFTHSRISVR